MLLLEYDVLANDGNKLTSYYDWSDLMGEGLGVSVALRAPGLLTAER